MASAEYEALRKLLKPGLADPADSAATAREKLLALHGHPFSKDVAVERASLGGVPCAWLTAPEARGAERVVLHFHGGAFVACGVEDYLFYGALLSAVLAAPVLEVGYRLAPEHRFPAALDDCVAAWRGVLASGIVPGRVGFVGDSCGGALMVSAMLRSRELGLPMPAAGAALGGWFDLEAGGSIAHEPEREGEPFLDLAWLRKRGRDYVGPEGDPGNPLVSPVHADLRGLPPLLLQAGECDGARESAVRFAAKAGGDGVAVTLELWPEMIHGWHGLGPHIPEVRASFAHVSRFFTEALA